MKPLSMMLTVLVVLFVMPMGAQTPATAPTCKVTGTVMDKETGEPEMMATVCVAHKSLPGAGVKKVLADSVGRFEVVVPVMPGQYTVTAAIPEEDYAQHTYDVIFPPSS